MKTKLLSLFVFIGFASTAQNLFRDNLSAYTSNQQLSGQGTWTNNSSNPGGLGIAIMGNGGANAKVLASPVAYDNYGSAANSLEIRPNGDGCGTAFPAVSSGDVYVGFVINLTAAQANNNSDFFRVLSGGNFNTTFRLYAINAGFTYFLSAAKGANGNPLAQSPLSYSYGENHLVIVKYSQLAGAGDDIVSVYVDPDYASGEPAQASFTTNTGADQAGNIDRMSFRQNWSNGMPSGKAGLISVAKTWADLSFVPLATTQFNAKNKLMIGTQNASSGVLDIQSKEKLSNAQITIHTALGIQITKKQQTINAGYTAFEVRPLMPGIYIVTIKNEKNTLTQKVVVQ